MQISHQRTPFSALKYTSPCADLQQAPGEDLGPARSRVERVTQISTPFAGITSLARQAIQIEIARNLGIHAHIALALFSFCAGL